MFPATALGVKVELYLGSTLGWVDITTDVRLDTADSGGGISITRGRPNEGRDTETGRCNLVIANPTGKYSPRNPASPYYGLLGRNTPIRVRVADVDPGGALAVDGWRRNGGSPGAAVTDPHTSTNATGDVDVRLWLRLPAWRGHGGIMVAGKDDAWSLAVGDTGSLEFRWIDSTSTTFAAGSGTGKPAPAADGSLAIRATLTVSTGAVRFYTAPTIAGPWTQLGGTVTFAATNVKASTGNGLQVGRVASYGDNAVAGELYAAQVYMGGALVASPDFTTLRAGQTSLTDAQGRVWTFTAGAVPVDRGARFQGEVAEWPTRWAPTGADVWVTIEANGITRRISQGATPVRSPLLRTITATNPAGYLPLEDGDQAARPASAAAGVPAGTAVKVKFGQAPGTLGGTRSVAQFTDPGSRLSTGVAARPGSTVWSLLVFFKLSAMPVGSDVTYLQVFFSGGRVARWDFMLSGGGYRWVAYDTAGVVVDDRNFSNAGQPPNDWIIAYVEWSVAGGVVTWQPWIANAGEGTFSVAGPFTYSGQLGQPYRVDVVGSSYWQDALVSHVATAPSKILYSADFAAVSTGYAGEAAGDRIARICAEEGIPVTWWGFPFDTTRVGPQPIAPVLDVLRDAAATDGGILIEARGHLGLHYRSRVSLYNQPSVAVDYTDLAPSLEPTDDDDTTRNDVTVSRRDGGSARAVQSSGPLSVLPPPAGVGVYDTSVTLNVAGDDQLPDKAGWLLHLGTVDEARYPRVRFNMGTPALAADPATQRAVALADVGDVASIAGLPAWLPPGPARVMVHGYAESIDAYRWGIVWNAGPASPWDVATIDGDARVAADGTTLAAAITAGATTLTITSTADNGPWTTRAAAFPLDMRIGAERVTATAITGTGLTQTVALSARAVNGVSRGWPAGTQVDVWSPAVVAE